MIREVDKKDIPALREMYNFYVENSITTFEEILVSEEELAHRISIVTRYFPWLVYEEDDQLMGFAYANYWKARSAYRFTLETTIYMAKEHTGKGVGKKLYAHLVNLLLEDKGLHRLLACISLPNEASVKLHESMGYRKVGHFSEAGFKQGKWIDVGYWEFQV